MFRMFQAIMPKEAAYFDMFGAHAATIADGAAELVRLLGGETPVGEASRRIDEIESAADDITREVMRTVRRTFVTPFDRAAIVALTKAMDDAVDEMKKTAKTVTLYEVERFEPQMREMAALAEQSARLVVEAVPLLRSIGRNHAALDRITGRIVAIEEEADRLHDAGLAALFQAHRGGDALGFVVGRELYSHIERVLDRLEDVANEIQGLVVDHA